MALGNSEVLELSPLDHIVAKVYISYILRFQASDTGLALQTLENGVNRLVSNIPFLAGDITLSTGSNGPKNRAHISPPRTSLEEVPMLTVKHHDHDEDGSGKGLCPLPMFIPPSQHRPVLRFQANVFRDKILIGMSYNHLAMDGTGAERVLQALAECCQAHDPQYTVSSAISKNEFLVRRKVSAWPSQCVSRMDHSAEMGPPFFDVNITSEQWAQMEAAMASMVSTKEFVFCPDKIRQIKDICSGILSPGTFVSSNDVLTAIMGIAIDRTQHPTGPAVRKEQKASLTMAVDLRNRIRPSFPASYLGNMIFPVRAEIYTSEPTPARGENDPDLIHVAQLASQVRSKLQAMNEATAYSVASTISAQDDWNGTEGKPAEVIVTSWRHLCVYDLDFGAGLGKMNNFGTAFGLVPGAAIILPTRAPGKGDSPWEVSISMKPGDFEKLENDPLLRKVMV